LQRGLAVVVADDVGDEDADDDEAEDVVAGLEAHKFLGMGCCAFFGGLRLLKFCCPLGGFRFILELEAAFDLRGYVLALGP
jgi:hypothetical protein